MTGGLAAQRTAAMGDVVDWLVRAGFGSLMVAVVVYFLKERRKNEAESSVAERTVDASVVTADAGALEAHVLAIERAFGVERTSKDRQIKALENEVRDVERRCTERTTYLEQELARKDETIAALRQEIATLTAAVRRLEGSQS